jgi:hypothetical protein
MAPDLSTWNWLTQQLQEEPDYASVWHDNLAVCVMTVAGVDHYEQAQAIATEIMARIFGCLTLGPRERFKVSSAT